MSDRISSYREYWKFYVGEHSRPITRRLHFVGTTLVILAVLAGTFLSPKFFIAVPVLGYGCAWIGHYVFEKNHPATFKYPFWSLIADFQMWFYILSGHMPGEVGKYVKLTPPAA